MNVPIFKARQQSFGKTFFRTASSILFALTLGGTTIFAGWSKDADPEKQANLEEWNRIMGNGGKRPDLILAYQAEIHESIFKKAARKFEKSHNCTIKLQRVPFRMLMSPLQDAMEAGNDIPDVVELLEGTMGYFADGPIEKVGFADLSDRLKEDGYLDPANMVQSRYSLWSSRGHIFAIPHDVHPVALCYRVDLIEKLGIDVTKLKTWDDFVKVGQSVTGEWEETDLSLGVRKGNKRFMIDFATDSTISLAILLRQRGFDYFDANGNVAFDKPEVAELIAWFVQQTIGEKSIASPAGDGRDFYQSMISGHNLFFFTPDWRTMQYTMDLDFNDGMRGPSILKGKLALMPMPVWSDKDGSRLPGSYGTGTWGGTGLAITKHCRNQALAWELAKFLCLQASEEDFMYQFKKTNIIPPVKRAWMSKDFNEYSPYFREMIHNESGKLISKPISIGRFYASMADDTAPEYCTAHVAEAEKAILDVYHTACDSCRQNPGDANADKDILELIRKQLKEKADLIREEIK